ncbi:MAG: ABC transporter permease [Alphaproteobacteria bacterium]
MVAGDPVAAPAPDGKSAGPFRHLLRDPMGLTGLILVVVFFGTAIFAPMLTPYEPSRISIVDGKIERQLPPSLAHPAGTDQLGRDVLTRVFFGGRVALQVAAVAVTVSLVTGLMLGMIAGYGPRWLDSALLLVFDTINSFPAIVLSLAIISLTQPSLFMVILVIIINFIPNYGRIARTQTLALRNTEFILAEQSLGAGAGRVLVRHVLPNIVGPLLILAAMNVPVVVTVEAGLSFLGLGIRPPTPSWGNMLSEGRQILRVAPWVVIAAGIPLVLVTLGFTFLGESLRDIFDPKLRRGR